LCALYCTLSGRPHCLALHTEEIADRQ
jgi:hypothetical protein